LPARQEQALYMSNDNLHTLQQSAIDLLKQLITIPSFSKEEDKTAEAICTYLQQYGIEARIQ